MATLLAGIGLATVIGLSGQPAHAAAATTTDPAEAAAGWLAGQLVDGERFEADLGEIGVFPDQGLTLDAVIAFAAAGVAGENATAALTWLSTPEIHANYLGAEFDSAFAGAYAKLLFTVQAYGLDPTSFGGLDLVAGLRDLQGPDGRFSDDSDFGDFSNAFSQSFAILALGRTAEGVPPEAVEFLIGQQCPDGGFALLFAQATCAADVDSTGLAAQALLAVGQTVAADAALDWLTAQQQPDGGFGGSPPTTVINANSTGLAAQGLRAGGRDAAADQAVAFLLRLQVGCDGAVEDRGAVAYDETGFDPATAVRATTQAVLGLAGVSLSELDGTAVRPEAPLSGCEPGTDPTPTPSPAPTATPTPAPGGTGGEKLPVTGSPALALVGAGVLLAGSGGALVWATRSRRRERVSA